MTYFSSRGPKFTSGELRAESLCWLKADCSSLISDIEIASVQCSGRRQQQQPPIHHLASSLLHPHCTPHPPPYTSNNCLVIRTSTRLCIIPKDQTTKTSHLEREITHVRPVTPPTFFRTTISFSVSHWLPTPVTLPPRRLCQYLHRI